jgi:hypothetical protein
MFLPYVIEAAHIPVAYVAATDFQMKQVENMLSNNYNDRHGPVNVYSLQN